MVEVALYSRSASRASGSVLRVPGINFRVPDSGSRVPGINFWGGLRGGVYSSGTRALPGAALGRFPFPGKSTSRFGYQSPNIKISTVTQVKRGCTFAFLRRSTLDFCLGREEKGTGGCGLYILMALALGLAHRVVRVKKVPFPLSRVIVRVQTSGHQVSGGPLSSEYGTYKTVVWGVHSSGTRAQTGAPRRRRQGGSVSRFPGNQFPGPGTNFQVSSSKFWVSRARVPTSGYRGGVGCTFFWYSRSAWRAASYASGR